MPDFNPVSITITELQRRLTKPAFEPFVIRMTNGAEYAVPTADHLSITKLLRRVTLETDDGRAIDINPLHVATIESAKRFA